MIESLVELAQVANSLPAPEKIVAPLNRHQRRAQKAIARKVKQTTHRRK